MKKILIICEFFPPSTTIGAVRPSKMAKYLTKDGYEVDVFTKYPLDEQNSGICAKVYNYDLQHLENTISTVSSEKRKNHGRLYRFFSSIKYAIKDIIKSHNMLKNFKLFVAENGGKYDAVFSTFGPLGCLKCGMYYKKKFPDTNWICDFRDPAVVDFILFFKKVYLRRLEQKSCRMANSIVAVSEGYLDRICKGKFQNKSHMIPNGYDEDDRYVAEDISTSDFLEFVYVGILYGGKRDISPVFNAIKELHDEGKINKNKLKFNYAGTDFSTIYNQAQKYCMEDILENHGLLKREECLKLQFKSDLLILTNWNTRKEYGVFPGKFLEYMLIEKPIISINSGDVSGSELVKVMKDGNFGVCWEEANATADYKLLKEYIIAQYNKKINEGKVDFSPDKDVVARYNYKSIIKKIEELINE